ncbi:MAG: magnesium/cobalt transporter CorA [Candidatus Lokiarchaeota archaeon]|nr:magnesium/cobalt transporter CorA [Candidatus Lokiarchaeota archaeon]
MEHTKIKVIDYDKNEYIIKEYLKIEKEISEIDSLKIRWIIIDGITDINVIEDLGFLFGFHPLVLEDILNTNQAPKYEHYGEFTFIVLKKVIWNNEDKVFGTEQISLILGKKYVITFREQESDIFNPIFDRIMIPKGRVREMGADYLLYTLLDIIIDDYIIIQETINETIELIEDKLIEEPHIEILHSIYKLKRNIIEIRKSIWPVREIINKFQREDQILTSEKMQFYLRDIYDHIYLINDSLQNSRDIITGMLDLYLSSVSNKMNDIMKVLTIISTVFIPLSFLAGFYGMNFLDMPELKSPFGYPILILLMILIAIIMILYFKKKKWL